MSTKRRFYKQENCIVNLYSVEHQSNGLFEENPIDQKLQLRKKANTKVHASSSNNFVLLRI
jgi:hypothetical protein